MWYVSGRKSLGAIDITVGQIWLAFCSGYF